MALDRDGNIFVGTGDRGEIFRVDRSGTGSVFFKSDEAQIRALAFDNNGNLLAGTDGSGLIYRISPQGQAFVLYSAPKKEITALAVDHDGNIYAAGAGEKRGSAPPGLRPPSTAGRRHRHRARWAGYRAERVAVTRFDNGDGSQPPVTPFPLPRA